MDDPDSMVEASQSLVDAINNAREIISGSSGPSIEQSNRSPSRESNRDVNELRKTLEATRLASRKKISGLTARLKKTDAEHSRLLEDLAKLRLEVNSRNAQESEVFKNKMDAAAKRITELESGTHQLQKSLDEANRANAQLSHQIKELEATVADRTDERILSTKEKVSELTAESIRMEKALSTKDNMISTLRQRTSELFDNCTRLESECETLRSQKILLESDLHHAKHNLDLKSKSAASHFESLVAEKQKFQQLSEELERKRNEHASEVDQLRVSVSALRAEQVQSQKQLAQRTVELRELLKATEHEKIKSSQLKRLADYSRHMLLVSLLKNTEKAVARASFLRWLVWSHQQSIKKSQNVVKSFQISAAQTTTKLAHANQGAQAQLQSAIQRAAYFERDAQLSRCTAEAENARTVHVTSLLKIATLCLHERQNLLLSKIDGLRGRCSALKETSRASQQGLEAKVQQLEEARVQQKALWQESAAHQKIIENSLREELGACRTRIFELEKESFDQRKALSSQQSVSTTPTDRLQNEHDAVLNERILQLEQQLSKREAALEELQANAQSAGMMRGIEIFEKTSLSLENVQQSTDVKKARYEEAPKDKPANESLRGGFAFTSASPITGTPSEIESSRDLEVALLSLENAHRVEVEQHKMKLQSVEHALKSELQSQTSDLQRCQSEHSLMQTKLRNVVSASRLVISKILERSTKMIILHRAFAKFRANVPHCQVRKIRLLAQQSVLALDAKNARLKSIADDALRKNRELQAELESLRGAQPAIEPTEAYKRHKHIATVSSAIQVGDTEFTVLRQEAAEQKMKSQKMKDLLQSARQQLNALVQDLKASKEREVDSKRRAEQAAKELEDLRAELLSCRADYKRLLLNATENPADTSENSFWIVSTRSALVKEIFELAQTCRAFCASSTSPVAAAAAETAQSILHKFLTDTEKHHLGLGVAARVKRH